MREAARSRGEQRAPMDRLALAQHCGFSSPVHGTEVALEAQRAKLQRVMETAREVWVLPNSFFVQWRLRQG